MVSELHPKDHTFIAAGSPAHQLLMPLLYFEIFSHPLTFDEICKYCHQKNNSSKELQAVLEQMQNHGYLHKYKDYFMTSARPEWVERRETNQKRAQHYYKRAKTMVKLIRRFPFVRAVFLSGSLSKGVMPKGGDVDYFVVTQPGRLWVARTFLVLFKKLFLLNSHKYFCVNYFVDERHLEIEEKNRFTATEIVTLLPVYNPKLYDKFYIANDWVKNFYPNIPRRNIQHLKQEKSKIQSAFESLLNGNIGDGLDIFFMKKTIAYWGRKFSKFNPEQFAIALKSRRYISKHHPQNFQDKVLRAYKDVINDFQKRNNVEIEIMSDAKNKI